LRIVVCDTIFNLEFYLNTNIQKSYKGCTDPLLPIVIPCDLLYFCGLVLCVVIGWDMSMVLFPPQTNQSYESRQSFLDLQFPPDSPGEVWSRDDILLHTKIEIKALMEKGEEERSCVYVCV